jgi:hypothetical protein
MPESVKFELQGTSEVLAALDALDYKTLVSIIKAVERKALRETIVSPLRSAIPYGPESKKMIGIAGSKTDKTALKAGVMAGRRTTKKSGDKTVSVPPLGVIIRWLDLGTEIRTTKKGANRGRITGKNVVQPFILNNVDNVVEYFNTNFGDEVNNILLKRLKNIARKG